MTNTSSPRTFSRISTKISLSEKRRMFALTSGKASLAAMASASGLLLLPVRIFMAKPLISNEKRPPPAAMRAEHISRPTGCKPPETSRFSRPPTRLLSRQDGPLSSKRNNPPVRRVVEVVLRRDSGRCSGLVHRQRPAPAVGCTSHGMRVGNERPLRLVGLAVGQQRPVRHQRAGRGDIHHLAGDRRVGGVEVLHRL